MDLTYKRQNIYAIADEAERKRIAEYCEGYKRLRERLLTKPLKWWRRRDISTIRSEIKSTRATSCILTIAERRCSFSAQELPTLQKTEFAFSLPTWTAPDSI